MVRKADTVDRRRPTFCAFCSSIVYGLLGEFMLEVDGEGSFRGLFVIRFAYKGFARLSDAIPLMRCLCLAYAPWY